MSAPESTSVTTTEDLSLQQLEAEAIMLTKIRDEMNELAELLEFTVAVIPEGLRAYSIPDGIINGFVVMLSDAEYRAKRLREILRK